MFRTSYALFAVFKHKKNPKRHNFDVVYFQFHLLVSLCNIESLNFRLWSLEFFFILGTAFWVTNELASLCKLTNNDKTGNEVFDTIGNCSLVKK